MFSIAIKIDGIENRRRSAGLLHVVMGFFLIAKGADYYHLSAFNSLAPALPAFLVALVSLPYGLFRKRLDLTARYNYWLRLVQVVTFTYLGFITMPYGRTIDFISLFVFAALAILLLFSERRIFLETDLLIVGEGIKIPGYYRDHLVPWKDLNQVVVREDFITLFHVKQKYLQYQVLQDLSTLEVAKMNAFCKEQIEKVAPATTTH
ncbi:MAG TPA: hypothetical protein VHK91_16360 [Flavisolibacter sp.]|nr:hypothetical protein [Flavisolibacter sp.]